ncbi:hypothetical protein NYE76_17795 [Paenibacillus sp. FSL M7-0831]
MFQHLRTELEIEVPKASKKLTYVPTEEELKRYYEVVWRSKNFQEMMIVKTLMYTGIRVSELANVRLSEIDFHYCQKYASIMERAKKNELFRSRNHSKSYWPCMLMR